MRRFAAFVGACAIFTVAAANAQEKHPLGAGLYAKWAISRNVTSTVVDVPLARSSPGVTVPGRFNLPKTASASARVPAVVYLHGWGGISGGGAWYAQALNDAGIATLELDMWQVHGLPPDKREHLEETSLVKLAEVFGALLYLGQQPAIDPARIGVEGASMGADLAIRAANVRALHGYAGDAAPFAAHVALYPACYTIKPATYGSRTGAPLLMLIPGIDAFSTLDECAALATQLGAVMIVYPGATHEWDRQAEDESFYDGLVNDGLGGMLTLTRSVDAAKKSRADVLAFFRKTFGMTAP